MIDITWMELVQQEMGSIESGDIAHPYQEVGASEEELGVVENSEMRKLWTLYWQRVEARDRLIVDLKYSKTDDARQRCAVAVLKLQREAEALHAVFWSMVSQRLADVMVTKAQFGLRKDWVVVGWMQQHPLAGLLGKME